MYKRKQNLVFEQRKFISIHSFLKNRECFDENDVISPNIKDSKNASLFIEKNCFLFIVDWVYH